MKQTIINFDAPDWVSSPCSTCDTYCCSFLPLCELRVETRKDMLLLAELCWFEGMVPTLKDNGEWKLFYHATCAHLHQPSGMCIIHNTPEQSDICRDYPAERCWYRKAFAETETLHLIRFNTARMERLIAMTVFDEHDEIAEVPSWTDIMRELREIPLSPPSLPATAERMKRHADSEELLLFPPGKPSRPEHLDLLRFRLGFPGTLLLTSYTLWCFALPALIRSDAPAVAREGMIARVNRGVYDAVIVGIGEHERYLQRTGSYRRIDSFSDLPPLGPQIADAG